MAFKSGALLHGPEKLPMFTLSARTAIVLGSFMLVTATQVTAQVGPGLGEAISEADLAAWDISIETNGDGLPEGSGTVAQGRGVFEAQCMACHGAEGAGQPHDRLVGGHGTLDSMQQIRTVGSFGPTPLPFLTTFAAQCPLTRRKPFQITTYMQ